MTEHEAIKDIKRQLWEINSEDADITLSTKSLKMAIKALEEVQAYRKIGLAPELIEAMQGHNIAMINDLGEYQAIGTAEEFKAYKDAEEQGLLLRLPCAIGGTIYKFEYPTIYDENGDGWTIIDKKRATVAPLKFALCHLDSIGKLYFLTREEAEQALAEMQKG